MRNIITADMSKKVCICMYTTAHVRSLYYYIALMLDVR